MSSPTRTTTTPSNSLPAQLEHIGLHAVAAEVDDFLARATKQRWSPRQILEHLAQAEVAERAHRSLERRLRLSEIKKFKPMADCELSVGVRRLETVALRHPIMPVGNGFGGRVVRVNGGQL